MFGGHSLQHTQDKVFTHEFPSLLTLPEHLRQMPPNTAMEETVFLPTLLYWNNRLLRFCFQPTEGMPVPTCSHKVHNGKRKHYFLNSKKQGRNSPYSLPPTQAASLHFHNAVPAVQCHPSIPPTCTPKLLFNYTLLSQVCPSHPTLCNSNTALLHLKSFQSLPCSNPKLKSSLPALVYEEQYLKRVLWYSVKDII